jgi:hypothetical protein
MEGRLLTMPASSTLKILTVVGARPQFIKAAMVSRAVVAHNRSDAAPPVVEEVNPFRSTEPVAPLKKIVELLTHPG